MNPLLLDPDMTGEFVITPEPNFYIVVLRVTPEEAAAFNCTTDRLGVCMAITSQTSAGVAYAYNIVDEEIDGVVTGQPGDYRVNDPDFNDAQVAALTSQSFEDRVHAAITSFCREVQDDLPEYYATVNKERIAAALGDSVDPQLAALLSILLA